MYQGNKLQEIKNQKLYQRINPDISNSILTLIRETTNLNDSSIDDVNFILEHATMGAPPTKNHASFVQDSIDLFWECMKGCENLHRSLIINVLRFGLKIIHPCVEMIKSTRVNELLEELNQKREICVISGLRMKAGDFITLGILEMFWKNAKEKFQIILGSFLQNMIEKSTECQRVVKIWFKCYGSIDFPIIYQLIPRFLAAYIQKYKSKYGNSGTQKSGITPALNFLLIDELTRLKNKIKLQNSSKIEGKCECCQSVSRVISFKFETSSHIYVICLCKICRSEFPKDQLHLFLAIGLLGFKSTHTELKTNLQLIYSSATHQTLPIIQMSKTLDMKVLSSFLIILCMFEKFLVRYPKQIYMMLLMQTNSSNYRIRQRSLKMIIQLVQQYPEWKSEELEKLIEKRVRDKHPLVQIEGIQLLTLISEDIDLVIGQMKSCRDAGVIKTYVRETTAIFLKKISLIEVETTLQIFQMFLNWFMLYLPIKEQSKVIGKAITKICSQLEEKHQNYQQVMIQLLAKNRIKNQHHYNFFIEHIPPLSVKIIEKVSRQVKQGDYWARNPYILQVILSKTSILKTKLIEAVKNPCFQTYAFLVVLLRGCCLSGIYLLNSKQKAHLTKLHEKILSEIEECQFEEVFMRCRLICFINRYLGQNHALKEICEKTVLQKQCLRSLSFATYIIVNSGLIDSLDILEDIHQHLWSLWQKQRKISQQHATIFCLCWEYKFHNLFSIRDDIKFWEQMRHYMQNVYQMFLQIISEIKVGKNKIQTLQRISKVFQTLYQYDTESVWFYRVMLGLLSKKMLHIGKWSSYLFAGLLSHHPQEISIPCAILIKEYVISGDGQMLFQNFEQTLQYLFNQSEQHCSYLDLEGIQPRSEEELIGKHLSMRVTFIKQISKKINQIGFQFSIWKEIPLFNFIITTLKNLKTMDLYEFREILGSLITIINKYYQQAIFDKSKQDFMTKILSCVADFLEGIPYKQAIRDMERRLICVHSLDDEDHDFSNQTDQMEYFLRIIFEGKDIETESSSTLPKKKQKRKRPVSEKKEKYIVDDYVPKKPRMKKKTK